MNTIEYEGQTIVFPDSEPIHLEGEADAYADEKFLDAYKRLYYVACECGYSVTKDTMLRLIRLCAGSKSFELRYTETGLESIRVSVWRDLWPKRPSDRLSLHDANGNHCGTAEIVPTDDEAIALKALRGVIHHNNGTKSAYKLPESLIRHVQSAIDAIS